MTSLRDRLLARERPIVQYRIRAASTADTEAAETALLAVRKAAMAVKDDDKAGARKAKRMLEEAAARRDECYEKITIRALPPREFERLADAYPEADDDATEEDKAAANEAFLHALFLACVEGDLTDEEWTSFLDDNLSRGERTDLYNMATAVNGRVRALDPSVPKG